MLTPKEKKILDRLIVRFEAEFPKTYAKYDIPPTRESLERVIRGSVLKRRPEFVEYVLKNISL